MILDKPRQKFPSIFWFGGVYSLLNKIEYFSGLKIYYRFILILLCKRDHWRKSFTLQSIFCTRVTQTTEEIFRCSGQVQPGRLLKSTFVIFKDILSRLRAFGLFTIYVFCVVKMITHLFEVKCSRTKKTFLVWVNLLQKEYFLLQQWILCVLRLVTWK